MIEKIKEKWDEILLHIKEEHELTDVSFKTWLLPTQTSFHERRHPSESWFRMCSFSAISKKNTDF